MTDLEQNSRVRINGYTPFGWLRKYGYSKLNRCVLEPLIPRESCPKEIIEVTYKIYGLKEWADKESAKFWYCWHEWGTETQMLSPNPVTQEDIDKIALKP